MDLKTLLESMKPLEKVQIGAAEGNGFFYIGTAGDFLVGLDKYNRKTKAHYKRAVDRVKAEIRAKIESVPSAEDYMKQTYSKKQAESVFSWRSYQAFVEDHFNEANKAVKRLARYEKAHDELVPLEVREVLNRFDSLRDAGYKKIIIAGNETGKYWSADEAKAPSMAFIGG